MKRSLHPKRRKLIPALTLALASLTLGVGGTLAYFTSTQESETAVTLGTVKLNGTIDNTTFQYYSYGSEDARTSFACGGTASLGDDGTLSLSTMVPGDKFTFDVNLKNESTIAINYRVTLTKKDGSDASPFVLEGDSKGTLTPEDKNETVSLSISLPKETEETETLPLMGKKIVFLLKIEAIQGNVTFEDAGM
jgi:predicted ribosomally synthesized peptide with SipW-like signal peptide